MKSHFLFKDLADLFSYPLLKSSNYKRATTNEKWVLFRMKSKRKFSPNEMIDDDDA